MKRLLIILLCFLGITSCLEPLYFEPDVIETSSTEEHISSVGDTCWFSVVFNQVETKFTNKAYFKPFKYLIEIEGVEACDPIFVETEMMFDDMISTQFKNYPEIFSTPDENGTYVPGDAILFFVPANYSESQRKVEVKFCVSNDYHSVDNWGDWETVYSTFQYGVK